MLIKTEWYRNNYSKFDGETQTQIAKRRCNRKA